MANFICQALGGGGGRDGGRGGRGGGGGGSGRGNAPRAVTPLFPKMKEEGWWLVLGDRTTRELMALKRVGFGSHATAKLTWQVPEGVSLNDLDLVVYHMSVGLPDIARPLILKSSLIE